MPVYQNGHFNQKMPTWTLISLLHEQYTGDVKGGLKAEVPRQKEKARIGGLLRIAHFLDIPGKLYTITI